MGSKLRKFYENRARDTPLRGVYIQHFDQISKNFSFGVLYPKHCTDGVEIARMGLKFGMGKGGQILTPSLQRVAPVG